MLTSITGPIFAKYIPGVRKSTSSTRQSIPLRLKICKAVAEMVLDAKGRVRGGLCPMIPVPQKGPSFMRHVNISISGPYTNSQSVVKEPESLGSPDGRCGRLPKARHE